LLNKIDTNREIFKTALNYQINTQQIFATW